MSLGERLKNLRKQKGLTQQQLADYIGCSHQAISKYENNENMEKIKVISSLSQFFNVSIDELINGTVSKKLGEITPQEETVIEQYRNISNHDKKIVNFILGIKTKEQSNVFQFQQFENTLFIPVCKQKASAGIGKIEDESNPDLNFICFKKDFVPQGTTHGIIIDGHSMEEKFFDKQIVFIQAGLECAPSDYGIFSVTSYEDTRIYCKQLMQRYDGSKYLHSVNGNEGDPDIDYENIIDIHCIGRILV